MMLSELPTPHHHDVHVYGCGETLFDVPIYHPSIAINRAPVYRPEIAPDYWIFLDMKPEIGEALKSYRGAVICLEGAHDDAYHFVRRSERRRNSGVGDDTLFAEHGTQTCALDVATLFTPRHVHLWGFDMTARYGWGERYPLASIIPLRKRFTALDHAIFYLRSAFVLRRVYWHVRRTSTCSCPCGGATHQVEGRLFRQKRMRYCPDVSFDAAAHARRCLEWDSDHGI